MLAMFCFNLAVANYLLSDGGFAAVIFLGVGYLLLAIKAYLIVKNESIDGVKEQGKQWLLEISLFIGLLAYTVAADAPLYFAILAVSSICGVIAFICIALHAEMSKM
jgi:hypothetical protein